MATKSRASTARERNSAPYQPPVALGPSNEEIMARHNAFEERIAQGKACRVSVTSDATDKAIDGDGDGSFDPDLEGDLMKTCIRPYQKPGMAYKLLSERCINHFGGTGGYQIVKAENGDPVRLGNMPWGEIPKQRAEKRQKLLEDKDRERIRNIQNDYAMKVAGLKLQARDFGLRVLGEGDSVENVGDGNDYDMGITVERGDRPRA